MARSFQDPASSSIDQDIRSAMDWKPVTKDEINQAYRPYRDKFGRINQNATDEELYSRAVSKVIDWWKRQEKARSAKGRAPKDGRAPADTSGGRAGGGNPFGGSGGSGGGSGGGMLPDTAMGGSSPKMPKLADIPSRRRDSASNPDDLRREQRQLQAARPLTIYQARTVLRRLNVRESAWANIPPYAFKNQKALRNYIVRHRLGGTASAVIGRAPRRRTVAASDSVRVGTNLREF